MSAPAALKTKLDVLWSDWLAAREKAMASGSIDDGIAAGRAWSRWLSEFIPDGSNRTAVHGPQVVRIRQ